MINYTDSTAANSVIHEKCCSMAAGMINYTDSIAANSMKVLLHGRYGD